MDKLVKLWYAVSQTVLALAPVAVTAYFASWRAVMGALLRIAIAVTAVWAFMAITGAGWHDGRELPLLLISAGVALGLLLWARWRVELPEEDSRRVGSIIGFVLFLTLMHAFVMSEGVLLLWRAVFRR